MVRTGACATPGLPLGEHWVSVSVTRAEMGELPLPVVGGPVEVGVEPSGDVGFRVLGEWAEVEPLVVVELPLPDPPLLLLTTVGTVAGCIGNARSPSLGVVPSTEFIRTGLYLPSNGAVP